MAAITDKGPSARHEIFYLGESTVGAVRIDCVMLIMELGSRQAKKPTFPRSHAARCGDLN